MKINKKISFTNSTWVFFIILVLSRFSNNSDCAVDRPADIDLKFKDNMNVEELKTALNLIKGELYKKKNLEDKPENKINKPNLQSLEQIMTDCVEKCPGIVAYTESCRTTAEKDLQPKRHFYAPINKYLQMEAKFLVLQKQEGSNNNINNNKFVSNLTPIQSLIIENVDKCLLENKEMKELESWNSGLLTYRATKLYLRNNVNWEQSTILYNGGYLSTTYELNSTIPYMKGGKNLLIFYQKKDADDANKIKGKSIKSCSIMPQDEEFLMARKQCWKYIGSKNLVQETKEIQITQKTDEQIKNDLLQTSKIIKELVCSVLPEIKNCVEKNNIIDNSQNSINNQNEKIQVDEIQNNQLQINQRIEPEILKNKSIKESENNSQEQENIETPSQKLNDKELTGEKGEKVVSIERDIYELKNAILILEKTDCPKEGADWTKVITI